jgi:hypothetical protein
MIIRKKVKGHIEHNDGEYAEIQTVGIIGYEKDLLLGTIQVHRGDTDHSCAEFQDKLRIGSWVNICTSIEVICQTPACFFN